MFTLQDLLNAGLPAISTDGKGFSANTTWSRTITATEYQTYLTICAPLVAKMNAAKPNAGKVSELKGGITVNQSKTWLERKIHGNDTETSLDASVDVAVTVVDLKPIIKNIISILYKRTETDKAILALLISIADMVMPDR